MCAHDKTNQEIQTVKKEKRKKCPPTIRPPKDSFCQHSQHPNTQHVSGQCAEGAVRARVCLDPVSSWGSTVSSECSKQPGLGWEVGGFR